ncbi:hypothetical protein CPC16_005632, partial [Podila verticillata]
MDSNAGSISDLSDEQSITVTCYGGGETFPLRSSVTVSTQETIASFKDHVLNMADREGFSMTGIDQQSMIVSFLDDNDKKVYNYENDDIELRDITPRFAFLPDF